MAAHLVLSCKEADFDAGTAQCAAPFYSYQPTAWPALSIADAQEIGVAMALLIATAWVFRRLRKFIDQS